jgi:signal transduction histidine kinase
VVQEALTNTLRHAGDARAAVSLRWSADDMTVEVRDDGDGPAPGANGGWGLVGLRERVAAVGGAFSAGPGPAGGFVVRAVLPREPVTP